MLKNILLEQELKNIPPFPVNEKFGVGPMDLEQIDKLGNQPLYGSEKLNQNFIEAIDNQKYSKPIAEPIEDLIEKGKVVPCYASSGLVNFITKKLRTRIKGFFSGLFGIGSGDSESHIMAFFAPDSNKVYMLFDNRVKYFIWADDEELSQHLLHELQHFSSWNLKNSYYSTFRSMFAGFYSSMFNFYFSSSKIGDSEGDKFAKFLFKDNEWKKNMSVSSFLKKYGKVLRDIIPLEKTEDYEWSEKMYDYLPLTVYLYLADPDKYVTYLNRQEGLPFLTYVCLYKTYSDMGYRNINSMFVQELLYPSEIGAITSEFNPQSSHYTVVKNVARRV